MTAMAMICRPDLIIFDEPTTALDVTTQVEVLAAIRNIVEQFNTAALYITHDLAVVAQMADRIMVLVVQMLADELEAGYLNAALRITEVWWSISTIVGSVASRSAMRGDRRRMRSRRRRSRRRGTRACGTTTRRRSTGSG